MSETHFQTKDLGEAAALLCSDLPIAAIKTIGSKCWFVFNNQKQTNSLINRYWNHELQVDAQDYFHALNRLKTMVFERRS